MSQMDAQPTNSAAYDLNSASSLTLDPSSISNVAGRPNSPPSQAGTSSSNLASVQTFSQPQNGPEDISFSNLTHEQLKQLHLSFLLPSSTSSQLRMQAPRKVNSPPSASRPATPTSNSSPQQSPIQVPQPAPTQPVASPFGLESGDYPIDFSPIPVQYAAINNNPAFLAGNPQRKVATPQPQQATMNRGVINQAYPLQYRFASNQDQKIPPQYLVHPGMNPEAVPVRHPMQVVVQQQVPQPQPPQPRQAPQRKRKSADAEGSRAAQKQQRQQLQDEDDEDPHQDTKRQKRGHSNDDNRLVKNRQAAQLFRQRQKQHIKDLEDKVAAVNDVNVSLTAKVDVLKAENKLVKDQLQYLRGFVATALQCAFPQNKEELQKRWETFQKAETERSEIEQAEAKKESTSAAELLAASEKKEKRKNDFSGADFDSEDL